MKLISPALLVGLAAVSTVVGVAGLVAAPASAALTAGAPPTASVSLQPSTGDSATIWKLVLDGDDDFCPGDGVAGYRWSTFIVPTAVDLAVTTWDGPIAGAPNVANGYPLTDDGGTFIVNQFPGNNDGFVNPPLAMTFNTALGGVLAAGDWKIGIACTLQDNNGVPRTEKYWAGTITLADSQGAGPHDFTYEMEASGSTTTTTTTTVADDGDTTTTTTSAGATTTTSVGASTTTTTIGSQGSSTTTTTFTGSGGGTPTTIFSSTAFPTGGSSGTSGQLASTGSSSTTWFVVSAILLLLAGRMVLLGSRPITVLAPLDSERRR